MLGAATTPHARNGVGCQAAALTGWPGSPGAPTSPCGHMGSVPFPPHNPSPRPCFSLTFSPRGPAGPGTPWCRERILRGWQCLGTYVCVTATPQCSGCPRSPLCPMALAVLELLSHPGGGEEEEEEGAPRKGMTMAMGAHLPFHPRGQAHRGLPAEGSRGESQAATLPPPGPHGEPMVLLKTPNSLPGAQCHVGPQGHRKPSKCPTTHHYHLTFWPVSPSSPGAPRSPWCRRRIDDVSGWHKGCTAPTSLFSPQRSWGIGVHHESIPSPLTFLPCSPGGPRGPWRGRQRDVISQAGLMLCPPCLVHDTHPVSRVPWTSRWPWESLLTVTL